MTKLIVILLVALVFEAVGVVWLSHGLKQIGEPRALSMAEITRVGKHALVNRYFLAGVLFELIFFVTLLLLLKRWDVSLIWPLTSLGFVITTFAAKWLRHEEVTGLRWSGVLLIVVGAALVGWSEKAKPSAASQTVAAPVSREGK
jgi:drug/metabolite transporter (DMT)-like permease